MVGRLEAGRGTLDDKLGGKTRWWSRPLLDTTSWEFAWPAGAVKCSLKAIVSRVCGGLGEEAENGRQLLKDGLATQGTSPAYLGQGSLCTFLVGPGLGG